MATIDDLMKKTEEGLKSLKETAQDIAFSVEKHAKIGKKKYIDITKTERNLEKIYADIGRYVFDELTSNRSIKKDDPYLMEQISLIKNAKAIIRDIEDEIDELRKTEGTKEP